MERSAKTSRIPALDGLRGVLAVIVLLHHVALCCGSTVFGRLAELAVWGFFVLSGYVLSRAYDGQYLIFLTRRVVRLWPVHAVCLAAGAVVQHRGFSPSVLVWYPGPHVYAGMPSLLCNPPAWSLCVEAQTMLLMPLIAWFRHGSLYRLLLIPVIGALTWQGGGTLSYLVFFLIGAAASRIDVRFAAMESAFPQWLGRISYSLYLVQMPTLFALLVAFGRAGVVAGVPLVFAISAMLCNRVEQPSIEWSRIVARAMRRGMAAGARMGAQSGKKAVLF
jgi:peptidoglycan/LPS O-acetylase OafA/YrhL